MDETIVPVIGIICIFGLPIGGWIVVRMMQHRERMEMIARGIMPPPDTREWRKMNRMSRRGGWGAGMGAGQMPPWTPQQTAQTPYGQMPPGAMMQDDPNSPQCQLTGGIKMAMIGLALTIGFATIGAHSDGWRPGPWLLGGLIPMFIGVAKIINGVLGGASLGAWGARPMPPPPPHYGAPQPPPAAPGYPFGNAEPQKPGPRYEELARPVPPPDRL